MKDGDSGGGFRGRGAASNAPSRFLDWSRSDDGVEPDPDAEPGEARLPTTLFDDDAKRVISWNDSPDIPFDRSLNPARGCEHGCVYCYARPTHAYLGLSPGLDFETKIFVKRDAAKLLRRELERPAYRPGVLALGANTDPYQPFERGLGITRQVLEVLDEFSHPVSVTTKGALVERDLDLLAPMARKNLVKVFVSIGTLDRELARKLEPRAASPQRRLDVLRSLSKEKIPCGVMVAAQIPALNDKTMEHVLEQAAAAGAAEAAYVIMRLPNELKVLFKEWLAEHYPERAEHVISIVRQIRGGRDNDPGFGTRMTGTGNYAELIEKRFDIACRRFGLNSHTRAHVAGRRPPELDCGLFRPPSPGGQIALF